MTLGGAKRSVNGKIEAGPKNGAGGKKEKC
jgi:hypothetical protein